MALSAGSEMIRYLLRWAAVGVCVSGILLLLGLVAAPFINSFPFGLLFLAWPTCFMMWMAPPDRLGAAVAALSVLLNGLIYAGIGRLLWPLRHRWRRRPT
jgi:hypothetical protein